MPSLASILTCATFLLSVYGIECKNATTLYTHFVFRCAGAQNKYFSGILLNFQSEAASLLPLLSPLSFNRPPNACHGFDHVGEIECCGDDLFL